MPAAVQGEGTCTPLDLNAGACLIAPGDEVATCVFVRATLVAIHFAADALVSFRVTDGDIAVLDDGETMVLNGVYELQTAWVCLTFWWYPDTVVPSVAVEYVMAG